MRRALSLLLCVVMLVGLLPVSAFAADVDYQFSIVANKTEVNPGDEVKFNVTVEGNTPCDMLGLIFQFDRDIFEFVKGAAQATYLNEDEEELVGVKSFQKESGKEGIAVSFLDHIEYSGKVGYITLKVKEGASFTETGVSATVMVRNDVNILSAAINEAKVSMIPAETEAPTVAPTEPEVEAAYKFQIVADKTQVNPGDQVKFSVTVEGSEPCDVFGLVFTFDRDVFEFVKGAVQATCTNEDEEELIAVKNFNKNAGKEGIAVSFLQDVVYSGKVGYITLKVKEGASFTETALSARLNVMNGAEALGASVNEVVISAIPAETEPTVAPTEPEPTVAPTEPEPTVAPTEPEPTVEPTVAPTEPEPTVAPTEPEHEHRWLEYDAAAPTCEIEGHIAYKICAECGEAWSLGENPMPLSQYGWILGATGHTWVEYEAVEPTCLHDGNIAYQQCAVCGAAQTAGENPMPLSKFGWILGATSAHTMEHHNAVAATCTENGHEAFDYCTSCESFFYADPLKLTYQAGVILATGHSYVNGVCASCGEQNPDDITPEAAYQFHIVANKTEVNPGDEVKFTVTVDGTVPCDVFGLIFEFDRDVFELVKGAAQATYLNEDEEELVAVKNFSKNAGTEGIATSFLQDVVYSGKVGYITLKVKEDASFDETSLTARPSVLCGSDTITATVDTVVVTMAAVETEPTVPETEPTEPSVPETEPPHVHSYDAVITLPSCTEGGYTTYTCQCGDSYVADYVAATGHHFANGACTYCGVPGHNYVNGICTGCGAKDPNYVAGYQFRIVADKTEVAPGDEVKFTITVEGTQLCDQFGILFNIDSKNFEFVKGAVQASCINENDEELIAVKSFKKDPGREGIAVAFLQDVIYSGKVGYITLKVKEGASLTELNPFNLDTSVKYGIDTVSSSVNDVVVTVIPAETEPTVPETEPTVPETEPTEPSIPETEPTEPQPTEPANNHFIITANKTEDVLPGDEIKFIITAEMEEACDQFGLIFNFDRDVFEFVKGAAQVSYVNEDEEELVAVKNFNKTPGLEGIAISFLEDVVYNGKVGYITLRVKEDADFTDTVFTAEVGMNNGAQRVNVDVSELVISKHIHNHEAVVVAPTCVSIGYTSYTCVCGDSYIADELPVTGHTYVANNGKAPTCTEIGWNAYLTCAYCDLSTYEEIAATGHTYVDHVAQEPTCTEEGWNAYQTCENCDYTSFEAIASAGHAYVDHAAQAPTCTEIGWNAYQTCARCDYTSFEAIAATGHAYLPNSAKAPTCTEIGWDAYLTCAHCDFSTFEEIAPTGHQWVEHEAVAPTCEAGGNIAYKQCAQCGEAWSLGEKPLPLSQFGWILGAIGHDYYLGACRNCGAKDPDYIAGDINGDNSINNADVLCLLWCSLFPEEFTGNVQVDYTGDGRLSNNDVLHLLWFSLFPGKFHL